MLKGSADFVKYRIGVLKYYTSKWTGDWGAGRAPSCPPTTVPRVRVSDLGPIS